MGVMVAGEKHRQGVDVSRSTFLSFATCGSVDDGKSTLIGRLLFDVDVLPEDQKQAVVEASKGRMCGPEGLDFSLLLDGLSAEREQGITIDVAYRFFETPKRIFRIADSPGHEQYTRNMATAASTADAAVLIVDARKGVLPQTRRHLGILALFRVSQVLIVINKMDLLDFSDGAFMAVSQDCLAAARDAGIKHAVSIPASAMLGDNVAKKSARMPWHRGPTMLGWLESVSAEVSDKARPFRMPIQWVNRPNDEFRGYSGLIESGKIKVGDGVQVAPSGLTASVSRIVTMDDEPGEASAGDSVTILLDRHIDAGRGSVITDARSATVADQFRVHIAWFSDVPLFPGRSYLMKVGTTTVPVTITDIKYRLDLEAQNHIAAKTLAVNEIGVCNLAADTPVACDAYSQDRALGGFILIDRISADTVGAGVIEYPLRRATNVGWHEFKINREARARLKGQTPVILWLTGLSGSGKSTIADLVERRLSAEGHHTFVLDGDNVRHGLNKDLGFTDADRVENVRRMAEVARLMAEAGLIVLVAVISPFRRERELARRLAGDIDFLEIFVDAPITVCERRDPKGLYAKARAGVLKNFTGVDSPYEFPQHADLNLRAGEVPAEDLAQEVFAELNRRKLI